MFHRQSLRAKTEQSFVRNKVQSADSSTAMKQVISFTLTAKGAFVREILLQEFAKGLDALGLATMEYVASSTASIMPFTAQTSSVSDEDLINLTTLRHLVLLLSRLQKENYTGGESRYAPIENETKVDMEEASLVLYQMTSAQRIMPILSIIPELPLESQQELVRLPADLAGRLVSRMVARTIRRIFG